MSTTIAIDQLRVGMFVHLDLGWWAHPFALSSFQLNSPEQIEQIRRLGLKQLRWSPEKSRLDDGAPTPGATAPAPHTGDGNTNDGNTDDGNTDDGNTDASAHSDDPAAAGADRAAPASAAARHRAALAAQRRAERVCLQQYAEAGQAWKFAAEAVLERPQLAGQTSAALTRSLLDKMLVDGELCIRVLADAPGERAAAHALNVAVIALLMGRVFGFGDAEMTDLGVGALMHDIGKLELPERLRQPDGQFTQAESAMYREHVAHGVQHGQRMALAPGALAIIAQHHELADGSGFPFRLAGERIAALARLVALVNRYDNLCNPVVPSHALTPHEALSLIFAQARSKFDATMLNAFIRMMGVYPPGSIVQLTDDRYASVVSTNSSRPLKPRVLVCDPRVAADDALLLDLEQAPEVGIRRSLKPAQLPAAAHDYLSPRQRVVYFFEPAPLAACGEEGAQA